MIRIPAVRQKGETDTSGTQYTITVHNFCSQWDGMFIVHDRSSASISNL